MGVVAGLILPPLNKQRMVFSCISCVIFHLLSVWDLRIHLAQNEKSIHHPVDVFFENHYYHSSNISSAPFGHMVELHFPTSLS